MKKIVLLILLTLLMVGCSDTSGNTPSPSTTIVTEDDAARDKLVDSYRPE